MAAGDTEMEMLGCCQQPEGAKGLVLVTKDMETGSGMTAKHSKYTDIAGDPLG